MNLAHLDMDDMSDFAIGPMQTVLADEHARHEKERMVMLTADYRSGDRYEGAGVMVVERPYGGCSCSAGREVCNCGLEQRFVDRVREEYDPEDQSDSADRDVLLFALKVAAGLSAAAFLCWVIGLV